MFVIHGSGRNADDYLYSGMSLAQNQKLYPPENILVIAPRFLVQEDNIDLIPVKYHHHHHHNGTNTTASAAAVFRVSDPANLILDAGSP